MHYIQRGLERTVQKLSRQFRVLLITGARQVGKTTMLQHLAADTPRTYVSLEDMQARQLAQSDPALFFQIYPPPVLIDEVQYAPQLFPYIKLLADQNQKRGQFWLTGSQHYAAMRAVSESLAGRVGILEMMGLSQAERRGLAFADLPDFALQTWQLRQSELRTAEAPAVFETIWRGGLPEAQHLDVEERDYFMNSYVQSYLLRDITELGGVQNLGAFRNFLTAAAALTGQQLNYTTLATAAGISSPTAKSWMQLLEGLGVVRLLRPFAANTLKRLVRTPKLYFCDTGLAAWLAGWPTPETLLNGAASGAFFENHVVTEFMKISTYVPQRASLSYFRNKDGQEIDLVVEMDRTLHPLEIKRTASPDPRDVRRFSLLESSGFALGDGGIICLSDKVMPASEMHSMVPVSLI